MNEWNVLKAKEQYIMSMLDNQIEQGKSTLDIAKRDYDFMCELYVEIFNPKPTTYRGYKLNIIHLNFIDGVI